MRDHKWILRQIQQNYYRILSVRLGMAYFLSLFIYFSKEYKALVMFLIYLLLWNIADVTCGLLLA